MADAAAVPLHPLLATRWSPRAFDPEAEVAPAIVDSLLEAARWAPSAGNSQPWAFIVGRRGDAQHVRLSRHLARSSATWAAPASVLVAYLSHRLVADTDWEYSEFAAYDLGQAVAHLSIQARAHDLHVRQFRAFDRDGLAAEFEIPRHWEVTTMSAIGFALPAAAEQDDATGRSRRASDDLHWPVADG